MKNVSDAREWEQGWDGHARAQLHRLARLALTEKLQWLEEADELRRQLSRGRAVRDGNNVPLEGTLDWTTVLKK